MRRKGATIFLFFAVLALGFATKSEAINTYIGSFCWNVDFTGAADTNTLELNVFGQDMGIYALYGRIYGPGGVIPDGNVYGVARIESFDNTIRMSLSGSGTDTSVNQALGGFFDAVLDVTTLSGTMHLLKILSLEDIQATMALTACGL